MKKLSLFFAVLALLFMTGCAEAYDDSDISGRVDSLENRVAKLEQLCNQMNTNISSLQTIVAALQTQDCIVSVTPITEAGKTIGYTITFAKGKPITIYHGKDGQKGDKGDAGEDGSDGEDGCDGKDGTTPIVGIKKDADGNYYWTLNGEWLYDEKGDRVIAQGTNGKDGEDGEDGADGADGISPQLKIEDGYWYISYDRGQSWHQIGPADGQDGVVLPDVTPDEPDMFKDVTQDDNYVYFTLADDTVITLPKEKAPSIVEKIKAVTYVPEATDGKASMVHIIGKGERKAELNFAISPKEIVSEITDRWQSILSAKAVNVETRAVEYIDIPILDFVGDVENGTISLTVSGEKLENRIFTGEESVSVAITFDDTKTDLTTDFIPLLCKIEAIPVTEIWYSSSVGDIIAPNDVDFGANIISNTYKDNKGLLKFDGAVTQIGASSASGGAVTRSGDVGAFQSNNELLEIYTSGEVKNIGTQAFYRCENLRLADIGSSVETIGDWAFKDCTALETVTLSEGLRSIGCSAFSNARKLKNINFPSTLEIIDDYAFEQCESLAGAITIPGSVTRIGMGAFGQCRNIENLTIENGVLSIERGAFRGLSSLKSIAVPPSVAFLERDIFNGCSQLEYAEVPYLAESMFQGCNSLQKVVLLGGGITEIPKRCFYNCSALNDFVIAESVTKIGESAFYNSQLSSITFPVNMTEIGEDAFYRCLELVEINLPDNLTVIGKRAFGICTSLKKVKLPALITELPDFVFDRCSSLESIEFPNGITRIGRNAFNECEKVKELSLPNTLVEIGDVAFAYAGISTLEIPKSVTTIGTDAFYGCANLETVKLPEGLTEVKGFGGCKNLKSINIPNSATTIGENAFRYCTQFDNFVIPNTITTIGLGAFCGWTQLTSIDFLPKSVKNVGHAAFAESSIEEVVVPYWWETWNGAFAQCPKLKKAVISAGVQAIPIQAFEGSSALCEVEIPESVTLIGEQAFNNTGFESFVVPEHITEIKRGAFSVCSKLHTFKFPKGLRTIRNSVLSGCSALQNVELPEEFTIVESFAFAGCASLKSIALSEELVTVESYAFRDCSSLESMVFPGNVSKLGVEIFAECEALKSIYFENPQPADITAEYSNYGELVISAFKNMSETTKIYVPQASLEVYKTADGWREYADRIVGY